MCHAGEDVYNIVAPHSADDTDLYTNPKSEEEFTLEEVYEGEHKGNVEVQYEYDPGDDWQHQIVFLGVTDALAFKGMGIPEEFARNGAVCLGGEVSVCFFFSLFAGERGLRR